MEPTHNDSTFSYSITNHSNNPFDNINLLKSEGSVVQNNDDAMPNKQNSIPVFRISLHVICLIGITLNLKICFAKRQKSHRHTTTTRTCVRLLKVMAIADTFSLFSLLLLLCTQSFGINDEIIMHFICKVDLFLMHTASAFSIWCWLVISAVRYIAIYRPYSHLSIRKEPIAAVILILILCGIFESWILYGTGFQSNSCSTMPKYISDKWASRLHILEIIWSYMLPCVLITILDVKVLCFQNKIAAPLRSSASFNTSPQFEIRMRSASECIIKPTTTNEMSSTGSPQSTPPISYKEDKKLIKQSVSFKENVSVTYNVAIPIRISTSVSSYKEMSILENPGYQEEQKEEPVRKQSYLKNENWLGIRRTNSFELLNLMPRKHSKRTYNQLRVLRRCLFITLLDLSMNLPNYLFRLYLNMISQEEFEKLISQNYTWIFNYIEDLSQLLYFAQFSLNALYLVYLVYDPPKKNQIV